MNASHSAYVRLHAAVLIAGGTGLFGRLISVAEVPLVCIRVLMAAVVLACVLHIQHLLRSHKAGQQQGGGVPNRAKMRIALCGVLLASHWVCYYGSIKAANVSIGAVCFALVGFFTAILEPLIGRHRPKWHELLLSIITVVGIALIFGLDARHRLGIVIGVVSSFIYTLFSIFSKRVQAQTGQSSSTMLLYELIGGAIVLCIATPIYSALFPTVRVIPSADDWMLLLLFSTVFTVLLFLLHFQALREISAFTVNLTYNLEPVYTILFAMILFGEAAELNTSFWIGISLIITSVALQAVYSMRHQAIQH